MTTLIFATGLLTFVSAIAAIVFGIGRLLYLNDVFGKWKKRNVHSCGLVAKDDDAYGRPAVCPRCGDEGTWRVTVCRWRGFGWQFK